MTTTFNEIFTTEFDKEVFGELSLHGNRCIINLWRNMLQSGFKVGKADRCFQIVVPTMRALRKAFKMINDDKPIDILSFPLDKAMSQVPSGDQAAFSNMLKTDPTSIFIILMVGGYPDTSEPSLVRIIARCLIPGKLN